MLADISNVDAIYIVCGRTDMRKSIDGLCAIIQEQFSMEMDHALYLFCGRKCDRIKAILKEPDGIVMIYKRLTAQGSYRWPRDKSEVRNLTWREFDWLVFCKPFLHKIAKSFCRLLHLHFVGNCKTTAGSYSASHKPLQIIFSCYNTRYGNGSSEFSSSCACSLK